MFSSSFLHTSYARPSCQPQMPTPAIGDNVSHSPTQRTRRLIRSHLPSSACSWASPWLRPPLAYPQSHLPQDFSQHTTELPSRPSPSQRMNGESIRGVEVSTRPITGPQPKPMLSLQMYLLDQWWLFHVPPALNVLRSGRPFVLLDPPWCSLLYDPVSHTHPSLT